jgi:DNA-binding NarL/FixJ family response regulator
MTSKTIRVLIGDDHRIVREGLKQMLADAPDIEVCAEATNGPDVLAAVDALGGPQGLSLVLLDIAMPGRDGLDVLQELRKTWPTLPVLMLSTYPEKQYAVRCIKLGAAGYLNKSADPDDMVAAVRKVAAGGVYVTPATAEALAGAVSRAGGQNRARGAVAPRIPGVSPAHGRAQRERNWCTAEPGAQHRQHLPRPHPGKNRHQKRCGPGPVRPKAGLGGRMRLFL